MALFPPLALRAILHFDGVPGHVSLARPGQITLVLLPGISPRCAVMLMKLAPSAARLTRPHDPIVALLHA
jgi:hypothetical protein